jgi:membrane protein DedA with SNARE-associated domain/rhodanese-related sulfurtransferase
METLIHIIQVYGLWVVFVSVLLDQGGLPTPSYAPMIVTAALAADAQQPLWPILLVATIAALIADIAWFAGGRRFGAQLLRLMCRISLSPDSCVGTTRRIYEKWGAPSLILAKYIPGFAAVSTTLAGQAGTSWRRFLIYDGIGAALWAGGAVFLGAIFHEAVEALLQTLEDLGHVALLMLLAAIVLFVAYKWWQRHRFLMEIRMARITTGELQSLLQSMPSTVLLDARTEESRESSGWIPGSVHVRDLSELRADPQDEIVVYCDCPNDASAATVAKALQARGFKRVRPLAGGLEAWRAQGFPVQQGFVIPANAGIHAPSAEGFPLSRE